MTLFTGSLETDPGWAPLLSAFRVRIRYLRKLADERAPAEVSASVDARGGFRLELDADARSDAAAALSVLGPTGETLAGALLGDVTTAGTNLKPIKVTAAPPRPVLTATPAPAMPDQRRLTLRLFRASDGASSGAPAAGVAVRLLAAAKAGDTPAPMAAGTTDASGYLALMVPAAPIARLIAATGSGDDAAEHEIALGPDQFPPGRAVLVLDEGAPADGGDADCHCDSAPPRLPDAAELAENGDIYSADLGAGCADLTVPNRTVEEFDFFRIVRTTDPEIQGLTMPEEGNSGGAAGPLGKLVFDRATLSQAVKVSALARDLPGAETIPGAPIAGAATAPAGAGATRARRAQPAAAAAADVPSLGAREALADTLSAHVNLAPLGAQGMIEAAAWRDGVGEAAAERALKSTLDRIPIQAMAAALDDPDDFTPVQLMTIERRAMADALRAYLDLRRRPEPGRGPLNEDNPVDWDATPEFYQATSIAHGHLLQFKQEWKADGYPLGELAKSIPLAPGQVKQIAVLDWDREDLAARSESRTASEQLEARLSRDRDVNEIANASFRESIRGGSQAHTEAIAGGIGFAIGPLVIGGGGGAASSGSTAWNDASRTLAGDTLNQLRDEISQGVSAVRSQRATVVQTVGQRERVTATTEAIANFNRCHAMTVQYFEVLRHFAVQERLAGVKECLFVPLRMSPFDAAKVLRWRDALQRACLRRAVRPGFAAIQRLSRPETTPPDRAYADDPIETLSGRLFLRVSIARPKDPTEETEAALEQTQWSFLGFVLRVQPEVLYAQYKRDAAKRDRVFRTEIAPEIARQYLESLRVVLIDRFGTEHDAGLDLTSLSRYVEGGLMEVALNDAGAVPRLTRRDIVAVEIRTDYALPDYSQVLVERATIDYRTERFGHALYRSDRVLDDVLAGDSAFLSTSALSRAEERNQLKEDRERRRRLLRHLNENIEYYHRMMWWQMDAARRFMLLDGFEAPRSGGRSVASVVENRLIGIVGNALVMPVAPGFQLDPALAALLEAEAADGDEDEKVDPLAALSRLYDTAPTPARRLSVPTKGVFAEAMNGKCNACEVIEDDRFWRWKDFPLPDTPPAIAEVSTDSRFATPGGLSPTAFPDALVKFQTIETAPDPTGMSAALGLLAKDVFKDITGLSANQKNAMAALTASFGAAESFAGEAFKLSAAQDAARGVDRTLDQIAEAKKAGLLSDEEASQASRDALLRTLGEDPSKANDAASDPSVGEALKQLGLTGGEATVTRSTGGNSETVSLKSEGPSALAIGASPGVAVRDYPDPILLETPAIQDQVDTANVYRQVLNKRQSASLRQLLREMPVVGGEVVYLDAFQSLVLQGHLKDDGPTFRIPAKLRIGYPADPLDSAKIAAPPVGTKYPLAIIIHGNSASYDFIGPVTDTGVVKDGFKVVTAAVASQDNHEGYDYLLDWLAQPDRAIVTLSLQTNLANMLNAQADMRAHMVLELLKKLKAQAVPGSFLADKVDFNNIALMGHSRGGEAVVLADRINRAEPDPAKRFGIKAVCSLAPTDIRGGSNDPITFAASPTNAYFVLYGGLDQDVAGLRSPGSRDLTGTGFRLYDRATSHKAMAFAPLCCHTRFNTVWEAVGGSREGGDPIAPTALSPVKHRALAMEYIGGFFDLVLNKDTGQRVLFDNRSANTTGQKLALQWRFGTIVKTVDDFTAASPPGRSVPATGVSTVPFAPFDVPASPDGERDRHVPHNKQALVIDHAAVGAPTARIAFDLNPGGAPVNLHDPSTGTDEITFGLGKRYPVTSQADIDLAPDPVFTAVLIDDAGGEGRMPAAKLFGDMANGWTRPAHKIDGGKNATLLFQQTVSFGMNSLLNEMIASGSAGPDFTKARTFALEFDTSAAGETWLTDVTMIKK